MALTAHTTPSGFLLPSIHAAPPFFTEQPNPNTQAHLTEQWIRLILTYARHRQLFALRVEDAEVPGGGWDEILRNERINHSAVLLYWRLPEEWADVLHSWATATGQLNTILTFYEISDPPVPSPLSGIPIPLLRRAITVLTQSNQAQIIGVADGEGVRFFAATK
ncbi:uncharacterized protein BJ212DRAFT_1449863 [Suillus subaureus]|uniref:ESCRT-II complex vps25 subunit n=1 Tax=Suillus subaureus TaxID=48587 RepID=A0A9P7J5N4_9AGAM|nr:uncharacterized protein BJ212DRAFT_1449863 [Suillus subaureus]KAG1803978.1 hypothetical protein BJ212DRAFT_1449863 [Suillus subaureus]